MPKKNKKRDDLDTETTFADMNVEGFKWYDPHLKKKDKNMRPHKQRVSRKEYWLMVRAAFAAYAPMFLIILAVFALMALIGYVWLS